MCGIAGYVNKSGAPIGTTETVLGMLRLQSHRGPDDGGVRAFSLRTMGSAEYGVKQETLVDPLWDGVVGFNRLSIVDLSINGHQPMSTEDGKVFLAFNGEIYNAFELKPGLEAEGYVFRSQTDTEVILALYLKFGFEGMVNRLNGMFSIVLADTRNQALFLARDRFGIKPLYVMEDNSRLAFSSEIKSFLAFTDFKPSLNATLLDEFLIFRNTLNQTLFHHVENLEPGTFRVYSQGRMSVRKYFSVAGYRRSDGRPTMAASLEQLESVIRQGVQRQLISDVKLGCQLSGGIDSSLVTRFAQEARRDDLLETISIVFEKPSFSEEPFINRVSESLRLHPHKFVLDAKTYFDHFANATWHFEAPLNHPNTIGIYHLSMQAKKHVTVLLSGEGADEAFGGYDRFLSVSQPFCPPTFLRELKSRHRDAFSHLKSYADPAYRAVMGSSFMSGSLASSLWPTFSMAEAFQKRRDIYGMLDGSVFDKQVKYEMLTYLPDLLIRQDKMSMAHSIENRVPFLDNEVVDASFEIPVQHLLARTTSGYQTKYALKLMTEKTWGKDFAYRKKSGFGIPLRDFFSDPLFRSYMLDELIPGIKSRKIFETVQIQQWVQNIASISHQELDALWIMISFEAWASRFKIVS